MFFSCSSSSGFESRSKGKRWRKVFAGIYCWSVHDPIRSTHLQADDGGAEAPQVQTDVAQQRRRDAARRDVLPLQQHPARGPAQRAKWMSC